MPGSSRLLRSVFLLVIAATASFAGGISFESLYAIGPDSTLSGPRGFYSISTGGTATWLFDFVDPALGFNGGLAFDPGSNLFYAIANDSLGNSSLVSFSPWGGGSFATIGPLGQGFISGLAYNSSDGNLYAISTDWLGQSSLSQISPSGVVTPVGAFGDRLLRGADLPSFRRLALRFLGRLARGPARAPIH